MTKEIVPKDGDAPDYGDFLDSDEEVEIEDECEPYEWYFDGKFYRVCLGEVLARRYRVEHKLGRGGSSTVWLAHGMQDRKDVALKIIVEGEAGEYEYQMHEEILRTVRDTSHLVVHQGTFLLPSENGKHHRVLVLPFLGPGLDYRMRDLPLATRVSSAKQLLVALKGLHDVGLVHGGTPPPAMIFLYVYFL